jgi:hypothetical protein
MNAVDDIALLDVVDGLTSESQRVENLNVDARQQFKS